MKNAEQTHWKHTYFSRRQGVYNRRDYFFMFTNYVTLVKTCNIGPIICWIMW